MKKIEAFIIVFFNMFAIPLLLCAVILLIVYKNTDVLPYMFGQTGLTPILMCLAFGVTIEGVMFFALAIVKKRVAIFWFNIILAPILFGIVLLGFLGYNETFEKKADKYDETFILEYENRIFSGATYVYKKTSLFTCEYVAQFGDDCHVTNRESFVIVYYENGIEMNFFSTSLYLKYDNGSFEEVDSVEDLLE